MKPNGKAVAEKMITLVGRSYKEMDCQAAIEEAVRLAGGKMNYRGSNDMARHAVWLGTVENARARGMLMPGAGLLIHEDTEENLPATYRGDGLGDFSHIALYVGEGALTDTDKSGKLRTCNAVHSSATMGRVAGTTVKNGYTHVMLFAEIDYEKEVAPGVTLGTESQVDANANAVVDGEDLRKEQATYVRIVSANGGDVRIREEPKKGAIWKYAAPVGTRLMVLGEKNGYYKVMYKGKARWVMKEYAEAEAY